MNITYLAAIERAESGTYSAFFPDLPGCVTAGDTIPDTIAAAHEALSLHIEGMEEDVQPVPGPAWDGQVSTLDADYTGINIACVAAVNVETSGKTRPYTLTLPERLVERVDMIAGPRGRSGFFASAAAAALQDR